MSTMNDVFTVKQVAEELGVSSTRVRQICIEHEIGKKITDHMRLLSEEDVEQIRVIRKAIDQPQDSFTVSEAAKEVGISESRVRQICLEHDLGERRGQFKYLTKKEVQFIGQSRSKPGRPKNNF